MAARRSATDEAAATLNEVRLRGRLAGVQDERTLPSGDAVVGFRLVVDRDGSSGGSSRVDTIDCAAFRGDVRRKVVGWSPGDKVEVSGSLRRRFFRAAGTAAASRYEVEIRTATRLARSKE
jgi:single-strand DNA-binding protein